MIRLSFGFCALRLCKKSAGQPGLPSLVPSPVGFFARVFRKVCLPRSGPLANQTAVAMPAAFVRQKI